MRLKIPAVNGRNQIDRQSAGGTTSEEDIMMQASHPAELGEIDIYDPDLLENPFEFFTVLTREAPVLAHAASGVFQVSAFALVKKALLDTQTFSSEIAHALHERSTTAPEVAEIMKDAFPTAAVLHTTDGSAHRFSRQLVNRAFAPSRVNAMHKRIVEVTDALIDTFATRGSVELMGEFAQLLPLTIIAEQLGVSTADLPRFRDWSDAFASRFSHAADAETQIRAARSIIEFQDYFAAVLRDKQAHPTDDVISVIAGAMEPQPEGEDALTLPQALQLCQQILVAGNESTASTISEGMVMLLRDRPDLLPAVRDDAKVRQDFIEEVLRLHSAVNTMWRVTTKDTELGGVAMPKGSLVLLRFGAANRDEAMFERADALCPGRDNDRKHVAFGFGVHMCIGAQLARAELDVAFERLLGRLRGWRLAEGAVLRHNPSIVVRALATLPLEFDPAATLP